MTNDAGGVKTCGLRPEDLPRSTTPWPLPCGPPTRIGRDVRWCCCWFGPRRLLLLAAPGRGIGNSGSDITDASSLLTDASYPSLVMRGNMPPPAAWRWVPPAPLPGIGLRVSYAAARKTSESSSSSALVTVVSSRGRWRRSPSSSSSLFVRRVSVARFIPTGKPLRDGGARKPSLLFDAPGIACADRSGCLLLTPKMNPRG
mmetsp:Transcript_38340/g.118502  ORF Transcript_38340/g.118502 Transcript_38340/m.118502 type:complete len:201 (+) Transcript_38340:2676-3278(+)